MAQNTFSKPLNLAVICDRVIPGDNSLVIGTFVLFLLCYAVDEVLGLALGLSQYTIAGFAGLTTVATMVFVGMRDLFVRRWTLFYLRENEIVLAERNGLPVVISNIEQIRNGALRDSIRPILVNTQPWVNRRIECLAASLRVVLAVTLVVDSADPPKVRRWLDLEESDVTNEIKVCVTQVIQRLGQGVALESPHRLSVALEYEINSRYLSSLGVTCRLAVLQLVDQHEFGVVKQ